MKVILTDIEGTTTSISFVYETLFPYAKERMRSFLQNDEDVESLREELSLLRDEIADDVASGREVACVIPDGSVEEAEVREAIAARALELMERDVKSTGLKSLQGRIWAEGFASGELRGHVFDDVPHALARWRSAGFRLAVYSSGSVAAQKLLFGYSTAGDLTPFFSGFFDTTSGGKKESQSYVAISRELGVAPADVLFLTDHPDEVRAAREAGCGVVLLERPGNAPVTDLDVLRAVTFDAIEVPNPE